MVALPQFLSGTQCVLGKIGIIRQKRPEGFIPKRPVAISALKLRTPHIMSITKAPYYTPYIGYPRGWGEGAPGGVAQRERGAKVWLSGFTERNNRGVQDGFIACIDGRKGLPEAIEAVVPTPQDRCCMVYKVHHSRRDIPWRERRAVAADLRAISGAVTLFDAEQALERFAERWDATSPAISPNWPTGTACLSCWTIRRPSGRRSLRPMPASHVTTRFAKSYKGGAPSLMTRPLWRCSIGGYTMSRKSGPSRFQRGKLPSISL